MGKKNHQHSKNITCWNIKNSMLKKAKVKQKRWLRKSSTQKKYIIKKRQIYEIDIVKREQSKRKHGTKYF